MWFRVSHNKDEVVFHDVQNGNEIAEYSGYSKRLINNLRVDTGRELVYQHDGTLEVIHGGDDLGVMWIPSPQLVSQGVNCDLFVH